MSDTGQTAAAPIAAHGGAVAASKASGRAAATSIHGVLPAISRGSACGVVSAALGILGVVTAAVIVAAATMVVAPAGIVIITVAAVVTSVITAADPKRETQRTCRIAVPVVRIVARI